MSHVLFALLCLIWGSSFILMKKSAEAFGPVGVGAYRVLAGGLTLAAIWWVLGAVAASSRNRGHARATIRRWPMDRGHLLPLAMLAVVGYAVPYVLQPYLVARHGSAFVGMMVSLVPLLTIAVSVPMLSVYPTLRQVVGVLGGMGFMLVIFSDGLKRDVPPVDLLLAAAVPLTYALANTYVKRRFAGVSPMALSMAALLLSGALLLPYTVSVEPVVVDDRFGVALVSLLVLGVLATGLAMYMFYRLIQDHGPLYAGMVAYAIPAVALLWGWLDGESLTVMQLVALAGIFAMVALVQGSPARLSEAREAPALDAVRGGRVE